MNVSVWFNELTEVHVRGPDKETTPTVAVAYDSVRFLPTTGSRGTVIVVENGWVKRIDTFDVAAVMGFLLKVAVKPVVGVSNSDNDALPPETVKFIIPDIPSRAVILNVLERALPLSAETQVTAPALSEDHPESTNPGPELRADFIDTHGLQEAVSMTVPVVPTKRENGDGFVVAVTVHLGPTVSVRVGLVAISVVAKTTAIGSPPAAPAVTVMFWHPTPPKAQERPGPKVRAEPDAVRVALPPAALGSSGVMQQVIPYTTPVMSAVFGMEHVTVFGPSIARTNVGGDTTNW